MKIFMAYIIKKQNESQEEFIRRHHECFKDLRDNYSEEIPEEIIHSGSQNNKYKVRAGWFHNVSLRFDVLNKRKMVPEYLMQKRAELLRDYNTSVEKNNGRTQREDIDKWNGLINDVLKHLETLLI